jgi:hypothetical protein
MGGMGDEGILGDGGPSLSLTLREDVQALCVEGMPLRCQWLVGAEE